ncbi:MAG: TonB-dependent receptor [Bryobacteraceae bacterium]
MSPAKIAIQTAAVVICIWAPLAAQETAGLSGFVWDPSGARVAGAGITAVNEDTGFRRAAETDAAGAWEAPYLYPGRYKLTVRKDGFRTIVQFGVPLHAAASVRVDFHLQIGDVREVVTVSSTPALLDSDDVSTGTLVGRNWIDRLPLDGRGILSLLELAPGSLITPATGGEAGQFTVNGQRPNANYFTVDGVSANTGANGGGQPAQMPGASLPGMTAFGSLHVLASIEALDEFQLRSSSFSGQYGPSPGGQVALSTRSGSNEFHGVALGVFRNQALDANDWFANSTGQPRQPLRFEDFGGALGGPIRRNRTFFFVSYEGLRLRQPYTWQATVPSLATRAGAPPQFQPILQAFPAPNGPDLGGGIAQWTGSASRPSSFDGASVRLDHALTRRLLLFGRFSDTPSATAFGSPAINTLTLRDDSATIGLNAALTPSASNELRLNTTETSGSSVWEDSGIPTTSGCYTDAALFGPEAPCVSFYRFVVGGIEPLFAGANAGNAQRQWNLVDSVETRKGAHEIRAGIDYLRLGLRRSGPLVSVTVTAGSLQALLDSGFSVGLSESAQNSTSIAQFAAYGEDTWRVNPRLTFSYGLRWDLDPAPRAPAAPTPVGPAAMPGSELPIWNPRYTDVAPRIGAAYRLTADGRTVLRAGAGRYFDADFGAAVDGINGAPYNSWQFNGGAGGPSTVVSAPTLVTYGFAPDLRVPSTWEWNVTLDRVLTGSDALSVAWVGSAANDLLRREIGPQSGTAAEIVEATNHGWSRYEALQAQYRRHLARHWQAQVSYSWSHSIDNSSSDAAVFWAPSAALAAADTGSSDFDVRHAVAAALSVDLPHGWSLDGMFCARTGFPLTVLDDETAMGLSLADILRPNLEAGEPVWMVDPEAPGGRRLNPAAFAATDGQGNLGRNAIAGFGMSQLDLAMRRTFRIAESRSVELRAEVFNALNQPAFADPVRFLVDPLFGLSPSMQNLMLGSGTPSSGLTPAFQTGGPRSLQLVLRVHF